MLGTVPISCPLPARCPSIVASQTRGARSWCHLQLNYRKYSCGRCRKGYKVICTKQASYRTDSWTQHLSGTVLENSLQLSTRVKQRLTFHAKDVLLDRYQAIVQRILDLETAVAQLSDERLQAKTSEFRHRLSLKAWQLPESHLGSLPSHASLAEAIVGDVQALHGPCQLQQPDESGTGAESLDDILPEAFAVVREAARRVLGMHHHAVQLMGGIALHEGCVAEMQTGEGKTLVATLPVYLNALTGLGVHVITVNAYLAARDAEWVGSILRFLKLRVGLAEELAGTRELQEAFSADVTYTTPSTVAFAYLRDNNSCTRPEDLELVRPFHYALVDEADYLLIDQATNPYLLSGPTVGVHDTRPAVACQVVNKKVPGPGGVMEDALQPGRDVQLDSLKKTAHLTEQGMLRALQLIGEVPGQGFEQAQAQGRPPSVLDLWEAGAPRGQTLWGTALLAALKARWCYLENVDYVIVNGKAKIVDQASGRLMEETRWTDMLHQAVEYQHGLEVELDRPTQCSVTVQNLMQQYPKLCGMTGTAMTEEEELFEVYRLTCVSIPTCRPRIRQDWPATAFFRRPQADDAMAWAVQQAHAAQQPVLIGTSSVEESHAVLDRLTYWLPSLKVSMLNARPEFVRREAQVIAQAGLPGAVTIATNMAGRGTDIILGGNPRGLVQGLLGQCWCPKLLRDRAELASVAAVPDLGLFGTAAQLSRTHPEIAAFMQEINLQEVLWQSAERLHTAYSRGLTLQGCDALIHSVLERIDALSQRFRRMCGEDAGSALQQQGPLQLAERLQRFCSDEVGPEVGTLQAPMDARTATRNAVRAALMLWVWVDVRCSGFAAQVRAAGGLLVISAVAQPNRRSVLQLRGRAGRRGDPGKSMAFISCDDAFVAPHLGKLLRSVTAAACSERLGGHGVPDPSMLHEPLPAFLVPTLQHIMTEEIETPMREHRCLLNDNDQAINRSKLAGYQLRRTLLCASQAHRTRMLQACFYVYAHEVVQTYIDSTQSPQHWHALEDLVAHIRLVVNPQEAARVLQALQSGKPAPRATAKAAVDVPERYNDWALRLLQGHLHANVLQGLKTHVPDIPSLHVLGDAAAADAAEGIKAALLLGGPLPSNHWLPDMQPSAQEEISRWRQQCTGSSSPIRLAGRWAGDAHRLATHIAEDLMVAWTYQRFPDIRRAVAPLLPHFHLTHAGHDNTAEGWQRGLMLHSLDSLWPEFLNDCQRMHRAVSLRALAHHDPKLEFKLESGQMFVDLLERFRRNCVVNAFEGPMLDGLHRSTNMSPNWSHKPVTNETFSRPDDVHSSDLSRPGSADASAGQNAADQLVVQR